jgi:KDO2-lipid IV(A) lauroyltransferase
MARRGIARRRFDRRFRYPVEAALVGLLFALLRMLPIDWASALGGAVGRLLGPRLAASRKALRNIARAFPETDEAARRAILRGAWDNLGRTMAEYPHLGTITRDWDSRVEMVGAEHLRALAADGRPGLCITAHLGNWELAALACAKAGLDITIVYRAPNNPAVDRLLARARGPLQGMLVPKGRSAAKELIATLRRGGHAGLLVDQKQNEGLPIPFFGRDAMTGTVVADLALRYRAPVVPIQVVRRGARFRIEAFAPLELPDSGDRTADLAETLRRFNRLVEDWVRAHPGQWLWQHRRWPD